MQFSPDAFSDDWYGWITNQAGHALFIGGGLFLVLAWMTGRAKLPVAITAAGYAIWEVRHYFIAGDALDSFVDWLFVMLGALFVGALWRYRRNAATIYALLIAAVGAVGVWRRSNGRGE